MLSPSVRGATIDWTNTSGGAFSDANNWMNRVLPGINDLARFETNATYSVNLTGNLSLYSDLRFDAPGGLVTMNLGTYTYQVTNAAYIGYTAGRASAVLITNGTLDTLRLQMGANLSSGELTIRKARVEVDLPGGLAVGLTGTGRLTIADAQSALNVTGGSTHAIGNSAGSYGELINNGGYLGVTGTLEVGSSGTGLLAIRGGTNIIGSSLYVGRNAGSKGVLTMAEPGSYLSAGLTMGDTAGCESELYLSNGLFFARGETKFCTSGKSLLVLAGGSITQDAGNLYLPHYTGTGVLVMASTESYMYLGGGLDIGRNVSGGRGEIYLTNGSFSAASLNLGKKSQSFGSLFVYNATAEVRSTSSGPLMVAEEAGSTGLVVLADERAMLRVTNNAPRVGLQGEATLIISNGTANFRGLSLAEQSNSVVRVSLERGFLISSNGTTTIGGAGLGVLTLSSPDSYFESLGASANVTIGNAAPGRGYLYASNGLMALRQLLVGINGEGYVEIGSSTVNVSDVVHIPYRGFLSANGNGADADISYNGSSYAVPSLTYSNAWIGSTGGVELRNIALVFQLPQSRPVGSTVRSTLALSLSGEGSSPRNFNVDLYAIRRSSSSTVLTTDYSGGALIQDDIMVPATALGSRITTSSEGATSLASWLNALYDAGAVGGDYVFLGLRFDGTPAASAAYMVAMANNATSGNRPVLTMWFDGGPTGAMVMASAQAFVTVTNTLRVGSESIYAPGRLVVSNGTLSVINGPLAIGNLGDGYMYVGDATVRVSSAGSTGLRLAYVGAGTGEMVLAKAGSLVDCPNAELTMSRQAGSTSRLLLSNGIMNVAYVAMGITPYTKSEVLVGDATLNVATNWGLVASGSHNSTATLTLAHSNARVSVTNGSITMGYGTNSWSSLMVDSGSLSAVSLQLGANSTPSANGIVQIQAATVTLSSVISGSLAMSLGTVVGNTAMVVLAHSGSLLNITNGSELRISDFGTARMVISNGSVNVLGAVMVARGNTGVGEVTLRDGTLAAGGLFTLGGSGNAVVNLDHQNALITLGAGGMRVGEGNVIGVYHSGVLNITNGTLRSSVGGLDHTAGSQGTVCYGTGVINVAGGTLDLANGNLLVGNKNNTVGLLNITAGTALVSVVRIPAGATGEACTGTVQVSGGTLYLGGLESVSKTVPASSNILFSGGNIRGLRSFTSGLNMTLTNQPGPGLVTFDIGTNQVTLTGTISGPGKLRKTGSGSLVLNGSNSYTNFTEVTEGALGGTGTVQLLNLAGGVLAPGPGTNYVGSMRVGAMNWTNGTYRWEVQNFEGNQWDTLVGAGALTIADGPITIQVASVLGGGLQGLADNYDVSAGYTCVIASASSIGGFDADKFILDTSRFVNDEGADFAVAVISTNLVLTITPPGSSSRLVYWDATNNVAGIANGSGVWIEGSNSWLVGGLTPNVSWDNSANDRALFSYSSGAGPHTVRVDMAVATNSGISMPSTSANYTYELNGTGVLAMVGLSHSFRVERAGANLIVGAPIQTLQGPLVKSGPGNVYLDGTQVENETGWLIKTGNLYVGRGGTSGELGGGLISMVNDGGAALSFNRSVYTITNPIMNGITYITNHGGGYAWRAGATQNFAILENTCVVTQESGSLVFTNFFRLTAGNNLIGGPTMVLRGGSLYSPRVDVGFINNTNCQLVITDNGYLSTYLLNLGNLNTVNTRAEMFISNGTVVVDNQMYVGRDTAVATSRLVIAGGKLEFTAGSYLISRMGFWLQTGGTFTNPAQWTGNNVFGGMEFQGGRYYQGGDYIQLGAGAGTYARITITNDAEVRITAHSTNFARSTAFYVGASGNTASTGELIVAGGSLIMTNNLGRYIVAGNARSNSGDIVLGNRQDTHGILRVQGGIVRAYQIWMGGHKMASVSVGSTIAGFTDEVAARSRAEFYLSGGEVYTLRGISNNVNTGTAWTNIALSGGTLGALGTWSSSLAMTLTNSPGPGLVRFDPAGYDMILSGVLSGPGGLVLDGPGLLILSQNNTGVGGASYVSNGVLRVINSAGLGLGTNLLRVTGSGGVCGTGFLRDLRVSDGGRLSAGECTNVGTLTTADVTWSNMTYRWDILDFSGAYGTGWDRFSSTGTLTLAAGSTTTIKLSTLSVAGSFGAALNFANGVSYTRLIASARAISVGAGHTFAVDTSEFMNDEVNASVSIVDVTNIAVTVETVGGGNNRPLYWDADRLTDGLQNGTGLWNNAVANWRTEAGNNVAWNNPRQDYAIFGGAAESGSWTVNVSGISSATNVGMSFLSGGTAYTVLGTGYLSFVSGSMITAAAPGTINARLEGVGFTKVGAAALTLGGSNQMSGLVTISNGAVRLSDPWALGSSNGATVVASGAELVPAVVALPTYREPLILSGSGTNNQGALRFVTGSPTWVGTVTVVGATTRIGVDSGVSATLSTVITGGVADVFAGGAGRLLVNGGVQLGSGKIVKDGTGVLSLRGASSYNGGTIVSAGTLRVCGSCAANVAGTAAIRLENGTVLGSETAASTIVNPLSIWGNVQLIDSSTSFNKDLTVTGAVDLNAATRTITVPSGIATLGGAISSGGITKVGAGTLVLGGVNTYASATTLSVGTLVHNGTNASSAVTTSAGTKLLGVGSMAATTVNGEIDPGAALSTVGRLSMASLNLRPASSIRVTITNTTASAGVNQDLINCVGTLTVSATAGSGECVIIPDTLAKTPTGFNTGSAYSWKIISAGGLSGFDVSKFTVSTASFAPALAGGYFAVTSTGNDIYLKFFPAGEANIRVSVTDAPDPVGLSNSITYSIVVSNLSSVASPDMVLTNYLDADTTYQSSSYNGVHNAGVVTWSLSSLAANAFTTLTVVARADLYGAHTNVAHVSTDVADSVPEDNWATNVTEVACVEGNTPVINPVNAQSVVATHTLTFTVSAYDSGCAPPTMSATGLPAGVTYVTSNQYPSSLNSYITFTWTPTEEQAGTWPIRVMATDSEPNTTTKIVRIYVAGVGESTNSSGVPVSQTNWNVVITNINMSGNNAEVIWTSTEGLTYDVYSSAGTLGSSITWTRLTNGYEATASLSSSDFEAPEARRYFKVVPENEGVQDTRGIWAVFRPVISNGFNLVAVPVDYPSRSFSGALGTLMASVLEGNDDGVGGSGDEVLIMNDNGTSYRSLWLNASGEWTVSGGGSDTLAPGQGFFVLRRSASPAYPTFTGPVGSRGAQVAELVPGWNLLGLAEGWYNVSFSSVFGSPVSGALNSGWDGDDTADEIQVLNANGSYTRYYYAPDGHWYNAQNDAVSDSATFLPGKAYYFKRDTDSLEVRF